MSEIDIKELSDEILKQKLESAQYEFEKVCEAYVKEAGEMAEKNNFQTVTRKFDKMVSKIAKKYGDYLAEIGLEIEELEEELKSRGLLEEKVE